MASFGTGGLLASSGGAEGVFDHAVRDGIGVVPEGVAELEDPRDEGPFVVAVREGDDLADVRRVSEQELLGEMPEVADVLGCAHVLDGDDVVLFAVAFGLGLCVELIECV